MSKKDFFLYKDPIVIIMKCLVFLSVIDAPHYSARIQTAARASDSDEDMSELPLNLVSTSLGAE